MHRLGKGSFRRDWLVTRGVYKVALMKMAVNMMYVHQNGGQYDVRAARLLYMVVGNWNYYIRCEPEQHILNRSRNRSRVHWTGAEYIGLEQEYMDLEQEYMDLEQECMVPGAAIFWARSRVGGDTGAAVYWGRSNDSGPGAEYMGGNMLEKVRTESEPNAARRSDGCGEVEGYGLDICM